MALLRDRAEESSAPAEPIGLYPGLVQRARGSVEPSRIRTWIQQHRPPYQVTERSWFVMLAAICLGVAMVFEPTVFVTLAVVFAATAWWRRESARQGIFTVAFWALAVGLVLVLFSILVYVIQTLLA
ncbi:MAG: hypothetical protein WBZ04_11195 [Candidatus Nanopelagicales bacterium]